MKGYDMTKYIKRENGEGWAVRNREPFRISCCDCGLVHNFVITVTGKRRGAYIGVAAERNERATAQKRRGSELRQALRRLTRGSVNKTAAIRITTDAPITSGPR